MFLQTVEKVLVEPMNKHSAAKVVEILHENFTPRLLWWVKCIITYKVHLYKTKRHKWNVERTAEYLEQNYFHIAESIRLAKGIAKYPNLKYVPSRKEAVECLRSKNPVGTIDANLIYHKIQKQDIGGITE